MSTRSTGSDVITHPHTQVKVAFEKKFFSTFHYSTNFFQLLGNLIQLTNHEEGDGKVLSTGRPHGSEDGPDNGTTDADESNHDDEPANGNRLRHHHSATRFAALLSNVHRTSRSAKKKKNMLWHQLCGYNQSGYCV